MRIHREGRSIVVMTLATSTIVVVALSLLSPWWLALGVGCILALGSAFIIRFFRYPRRGVTPEPGAVYSPADGTVVALERTREPEVLGSDCTQVSIFMSVWNVHANWYPCAGEITYSRYHPGRFLVAWLPKSSTENERTTVALTRPDGQRLVVRQVAGAVARRIVTYAGVGHGVQAHDELGFIKFGSRVDLYLPPTAELHVKLGDKVRGGTSKICTLSPPTRP